MKPTINYFKARMEKLTTEYSREEIIMAYAIIQTADAIVAGKYELKK